MPGFVVLHLGDCSPRTCGYAVVSHPLKNPLDRKSTGRSADELPHFDEKGEGKIGSNLGYGGVTFRGRFSTPKGVGYGVG